MRPWKLWMKKQPQKYDEDRLQEEDTWNKDKLRKKINHNINITYKFYQEV